MLTTSQQASDKLIRKVSSKLRNLKKSATAPGAAAFVKAFYHHVPPDDIAGADPQDLAGAAASIWVFGQRRKLGQAKIRAFNPTRAEEGWTSSHTVVEIVNDDMPFLVDSVANELTRQGVGFHLIIHPIVRVRRDARGKVTKLLDADDHDPTSIPESYMHVDVDQRTGGKDLGAIVAGLKRVLADVRAAVEDWPRMRAEVASVLAELDANPPPLPPEELEEGKQFLRWVDDGHFTFLGYREYTFPVERNRTRLNIVPRSGLGVLRNTDVRIFEGIRDLHHVPPEVASFLHEPRLLMATKSNRRATVHRTAYMDALGVKQFDHAGRVTGARLFAGLFTSAAYSSSPRYIPMLRRKINQTIEATGLHPASHDGKALLHILETFPRDELFQISPEDLLEMGTGILHLQERYRTALFVRRDPFERAVSCLVYVPRDRYDSGLRRRFQRILERAFDGECTSYDTSLDPQSVLARIHYIVRTKPGEIPPFDLEELEGRIISAARSWFDRLRNSLVRARGEEQGLALAMRYADAFNAAYQESYNVARAVEDIDKLEEVVRSGVPGMNLHRRDDARTEDHVHLKIYNPAAQLALSDVLPVLENLGFKVIAEQSFDVAPKDSDPIWIHDFSLVRRDGTRVDVDAVRDAFHEALAHVWAGRMENDGFNRLVLVAGMRWRQIVILRAYSKYLRQAQIPFSHDYMETTLAKNSDLTRLIVDLFDVRFDPDRPKDAERKETRIADAISSGLDSVANLDEDRIIRRFVNLVQSTLRTNFYQMTAGGDPKSYVSFKFDSRSVEDLPLPRPMFEIFVYSPRVEGVHLRFGKVARGGLRWSDRREDFRTEILGLVKAQQVKNAVIVPVGSKGGFVVRRPPAGGDREAVLKEGIACYKTFISGLLDLTDNLVGSEVVPPVDVVRKDADDPYLVVAADKGTATFSDIANGVASDYGFWLDDAFASGGSAGYDHKKMGITARGAWESVKRHFRELGTNIQNEDFNVVGVGDMSGDVFGNGMLLSQHIKLVAAFNHLHIFVDPDPDPARSFAERKRLFGLPRSTWSDYDPKALSKGGAVYDRSAKSLKLTPEIKAAFDIAKDSVAPTELIRAVLLHGADLLWFGGIGTYVKSRVESHADVGDRANDAIRVDGEDLKARVVGEGANLGVTQLGRIEFAMTGGHINTDSVDNSAGVDCSDHEVNIKILLGAAEREGKLTRNRRNNLLESMTDEVAELVLRDNYLQTGSLSVTEFIGPRLTDRLSQFMRSLERSGHLNRTIEFLPDDEELADRKADNVGVTGPELCILIAYAKIVLYDELLASDFPDDPYMVADLERYFPEPLHGKFRDAIAGHPLRREIVATVTTNSMINRIGITFAHEVKERTGATAGEVARAYAIGRTVFAMRDMWASIEALDNQVPAAVQSEMMMAVGRLLDRGTTWFLRHGGQPLNIAAEIDAYGAGVGYLLDRLDSLISDSDRQYIQRRADGLIGNGAPADIAQRVASLRILYPACDIVHIAATRKMKVEHVARVFYAVGDQFGFGWLRRTAAGLPAESHWDKQATTAIIDDLYGHQYDLTSKVLAVAKGNIPPAEAIDCWCQSNGSRFQASTQMIDEIRNSGSLDLAKLAVANRQLRAMTAA